MAQTVIRYNSDNKIVLQSPTDYTDINDPKPIAASEGYTINTAEVRLYDADKRTHLAADLLEAETTVNVQSANAFEIGDIVTMQSFVPIVPGTYSWHSATIIAVDPIADTLDIDTPLAAGQVVYEGQSVAAQLGDPISLIEMTSTPSIDTDLQAAEVWGYEGTIEAFHTGLLPGMTVRVEGDFVANFDISDRPIRANVRVIDQTG
jgi:hypothetical protein